MDEEKSSRRAGSGWKATKLQAGGVGQVSCATLVVLPCPPALHWHSLYNTRRAPKVVCPVMPHNVPDAHSPVTATCGDVFEGKGLECQKSPAAVLSSQHTHPAKGPLPVASSVETGSKAMLATGAVCTAFHRRLMLPSRQAH